MSLLILKNGLLDTIQDQGRYGHQHLGINPGGAMDRSGMQNANILAGNEPGDAVIEMHFPAAEIRFDQPALIALAGADFTAVVNGKPIPLHQPVIVGPSSVLRFSKRKSGARVYLAVYGGLQCTQWLGSCSTGSMPGTGGRVLRKNDRIFFKQERAYPIAVNGLKILPWQLKAEDQYRKGSIRFVQGKEFAWLDRSSRETIVAGKYRISAASDRMGYRLQSPALHLNEKKELISSAVTRGTMQLLPSGQLIVLMAAHQTTGGYPRIGHVISADLSSLAQLCAGEDFSLSSVSLDEAQALFAQQQMNLRQLQNACNFRLRDYLDTTL